VLNKTSWGANTLRAAATKQRALSCVNVDLWKSLVYTVSGGILARHRARPVIASRHQLRTALAARLLAYAIAAVVICATSLSSARHRRARFIGAFIIMSAY